MTPRTRRLIFGGTTLAALAGAAWWLLLAGGDAPQRSSCAADPQVCETACDDGDLASCHALGEHFYYNGPQQDHSRALAAYTKACRIGSAGRRDEVAEPDPLGWSCFHAGVIWSGEHGHAQDRARAWAFYSEACGHRFAHGCEALGEMYESGAGAPRDEVEAHRYYALGCGYGSEPACEAANRLAP